MYIESKGVIDLKAFLDMAESDPSGSALWSNTELGKKYSKKASDLVPKFLDRTSGVYFWVDLKEKSFIYIGQSHNLRRRLLEGLRHGRVAFWAKYGYKTESWDLYGQKLYPNKWPQYRKEAERHSRKSGATHIIWIATPSLAHYRLELLEALMIDILKPKANTQNTKEHRDIKFLKLDIRNELENIAMSLVSCAKEQGSI